MFVLIRLFASIFFLPLPNEGDEWKKSMDKDGIAIFTRSIESSQFKEFQARAQMEGNFDELKEILFDIDRYHEWMPDCKSAEIVSEQLPDSVIYHMKLKVPFPFENRDVVQQLIVHENQDTLEIEIVNKPDEIEKENKYVRMPVGKGKWTVTSTSDNEISILFQYFADPGGNIPAWLVNSFVVKNPHMMLQSIREQMAD